MLTRFRMMSDLQQLFVLLAAGLTVLLTLIASLFVFAALVFIPWPRDPPELFRDWVTDPIPASVQILNGQDIPTFRDPAAFLEFTIAPEDLRALLDNDKFEVVSEDANLMYKSGLKSGYRIAWWNPESLGAERILYKGWGVQGFYNYEIYTNAAHDHVLMYAYDM